MIQLTSQELDALPIVIVNTVLQHPCPFFSCAKLNACAANYRSSQLFMEHVHMHALLISFIIVATSGKLQG